MVNGGHIFALLLGGAVVALGMRARFAQERARWMATVQALRHRLKAMAA